MRSSLLLPRLYQGAFAPLLAVVIGSLLGVGWVTFVPGGGRPTLPELPELPSVPVLNGERPLARTELALAMEEAREAMVSGQPWTAWTLLRPRLRSAVQSPHATLFAAQAAAGWEGWDQVRTLLRDQPWLDTVEDGAGWMLVARAEEVGQNWDRAIAAYGRYTQLATNRTQRGLAAARLGRVLAFRERHAEAAAAFAAAAADLPALEDWLNVLRVESAGRAGQVPTGTTSRRWSSGAARARRAQSEAEIWLARGDTARAVVVLGRAYEELRLGAPAEAAEIAVRDAELLAKRGRASGARTLLRAVAGLSIADSTVRAAAARALGELFPERTTAEELARADAFVAAGRPGLAARALRGALRAGAADTPELRLRIADLLWEERDFGPAGVAYQEVAVRARHPATRAQAALGTARVRLRTGDETGGRAELREVAIRWPGTAAAGSAWFALGETEANPEQALRAFSRAAAVAASPDARKAMFRVGRMYDELGNPGAAARAWNRYVARYPRGEPTAEAAYLAGKIYERSGSDTDADRLYRAAVAAEPTAYHATRAAEKLGTSPLAAVLNRSSPGPARAVNLRVQQTLRRLALLDSAGLADAWNQEFTAGVRHFAQLPEARLALAEGVRDAGHPLDAINLGRKLEHDRGGAWDRRLLQVVFPLPSPEAVVAAANRAEIDPMLLAGLARQESSWDADARSRVGARGLTQIMPSTAPWLVRGLRISDYSEALLTVPEVNLQMGALFLADQLRHYEGAVDLALASYNAGQGPVDRWVDELPYGGDPDRFRERIPFAETREYVKRVLRNAAVYRALYGS